MYSDKKNNAVQIKEIDFQGAAVINDKGREIAISEDIIQSAFEKLVKMSTSASRTSS